MSAAVANRFVSYAFLQQDVGAIRNLLDGGLNPNLMIRNVQPFKHQTDALELFTLLGFAVYHKNLPLTRLLLSHGADVNGLDQFGCTALHILAMEANEHDFTDDDAFKNICDILEALLAAGADTEIEDSDGLKACDVVFPEWTHLKNVSGFVGRLEARGASK